MEHLEPPTAPEFSTTAQVEAVQPTHEPSLTPSPAKSEPSPPYSGPTDKASVIQAIIDNRCTPREAAGLLLTSTGSIRKLVSRERARQATETHALKAAPSKCLTHAPSVSHHISPQAQDSQPADDEAIEPETEGETEGETNDHEQDLQTLQPPPNEGSETGETADPAQDEDPATPQTNESATRPPLDKRAIALANLQKANAANAQPKEKKPLDEEGSFERDELETLSNLHKALARSMRAAENGRDAQAYSVAMLNVLDARRRAAGKDSTLVKSQSTKALSTRNSIVFIGNAAAPTPAVAKLQRSKVIEVADESLSDAPPALKAALQAAPAYVRSL